MGTVLTANGNNRSQPGRTKTHGSEAISLVSEHRKPGIMNPPQTGTERGNTRHGAQQSQKSDLVSRSVSSSPFIERIPSQHTHTIYLLLLFEEEKQRPRQNASLEEETKHRWVLLSVKILASEKTNEQERVCSSTLPLFVSFQSDFDKI